VWNIFIRFVLLCVEKIIDVLLVARKHADPTMLKRNANGRCSYKLGDVYRAVTGDNLDGAHGAICDAKAVTRVILESTGINQAIAEVFVEVKQFSCPTSKSLMSMVRSSIAALNKFYGKRKITIVEVFMNQAKKKRKTDQQ
jgi:hypothetical protein